MFSDQPQPPLADRMRPAFLEQVLGQDHLLGVGKPLFEAARRLHSLLLWGPPGTGKTTLARLLTKSANARMIQISAVTAGVGALRDALKTARMERAQGRQTALFIDEIHRFNKAQQDVLLPAVEEGLLLLIGATTENPSFEVNKALLSRLRVYRLAALEDQALLAILDRALAEPDIRAKGLRLEDAARSLLINAADGDARRLLNIFELATLACAENGVIDAPAIQRLSLEEGHLFDKGGDQFYDQISALHKAVRGSAPDAALYWLARMLDGGCDPLYIARRVVRMASEDIGNADPRGLTLALSAWDVQTRLGSPEGELSIAQAVVFLACAPKSNAVYEAFKKACRQVRETPSLEVPMHLRNAPTALMKEMGHSKDYHYAHDFPEAYVPGEDYFPPKLSGTRYYEPLGAGLEIRIGERLERLRALDKTSAWQRYGQGTDGKKQ